MKRGAEKQLSKDDGDEEVDEGSEGQIGMRKADDKQLATRKMRSLPKRSSLAPMASASKDASSPMVQEPSKPSPFGGFGSSTMSTSSPFSFTSTPTPAVAPLSTSKSAPTLSSTPSPPFGASQATKVENTPEYKYYASLRGLNVSFLAAAKKTIDKDPFADMSELLEKYKGLRLDAKKDLDSAAASTPKAAPTPAPPAKLPSLPSVPMSFAGFKPPAEKSTTRDSTTKTIQAPPAGFTPSLGLPSAPFSFGASSSSTKEAAPAPAPAAAPVALKPSAFEFRAPTQLASKPGEAEKPPAASPFGVKPPSPAKTTNFFNLGAASTSASKDAPASTNPFGQSTMLFGNKTGSSPATPKKEVSNPFSSTTSPSANPFGAPSTPSAFGGGFGGFGKSPGGTSGSLGNPVGFGFGANKASNGDSSSEEKKSSNFSFAFGATPIGAPAKVALEPPAPVASSSAAATNEEETAGSAEGGETENNADGEAKTSTLMGKNPHDEEGEGEEDEQTVHAVKLQVYRMQDKAWANLGAGILRVKKHNNDDSRRLLLRNSSTGKININFKLYPGFQPKLQKKSLSFMGHDDGKNQMYMVRPKTEEQAKELTEVLEREIEFVKAKSDA